MNPSDFENLRVGDLIGVAQGVGEVLAVGCDGIVAAIAQVKGKKTTHWVDFLPWDEVRCPF